ncbi:MAG: DUF362 domain-containing protein [Spirochaetaceae bacterium]|jgi:uncharacterized Fe-S center protein|nr:DUF362 domain-containing protein [Spirochaetaceae bacterium]
MKTTDMTRREFIKKAAAGAAALSLLGNKAFEDDVRKADTGIRQTQAAGASKVYFSPGISAQGLLAAYKALGISVTGKAAVKLHMGERGNTNYLNPALLRSLVAETGGTFTDSNTYYGGARSTTAGHLEVAREHGFTYAPVDILDADGDISLPVRGGRQLKEAIVGAHIRNYDWIISVAHFKGHSMAGFGGTFKNMAVGIASPRGKRAIHSSGSGGGFSSSGEPFFEKIVEYNRAVMDSKNGRILFINVLNNLSVSCDCDARAPKAAMADIGILSSTDPVALERASLDQIYARPEGERKDLVNRIESRGGAYQIVYAEQIGLGSQRYELVRI